ncbi:MAG: hypothetical protein QOE68_353 [Thermoanaerobaculia bacterium]|jgi:hypothetical protein|nr:hypothetical protein [Thermoanaerobaculia bacterium]
MTAHMTVKRLFALASVVAAVAFPASAQTRELNPTVKVLARPQSPVPAECATDPATVPALEAEMPAVEVTSAVPPSNDLRASLRRLQVAAEGDDYAVFKSAFAEARRAVASHPPGGERNAANDALQVFADIGRVWDYAMTSPTGSFFDASAQSGSLLNALKRYPEYGRTIADQTVTVGGKTLYPTPETRRFLSRESARRLTRLGVSTPAHVARGSQPEPLPRRLVAAPPVVKKPVQIAAKPPAPKTTTAPKKTASTTSASKKTEPKPAVKIAKATPPKTKEVAIKATPLPKPKPAAPPPVKVAETSTMPPGPPIVATPQPTAPPTTTAAPATQTTATTAAAPPPATTSTTDTTVTSAVTDTNPTAAPDTAATGTAVPPAKQNGNMNLILAVVLILVGIGVLIVLFRASD